MSKVTSPVPAALTRPVRVATSEISSPTVAELVALVTSTGPAFSTVVVSFSSEHDEGPALFVFGESPLYSATQTYFPAVFGVKLTSYSPSPFTSTFWGFFFAVEDDLVQREGDFPAGVSAQDFRVDRPVAPRRPARSGLVGRAFQRRRIG